METLVSGIVFLLLHCSVFSRKKMSCRCISILPTCKKRYHPERFREKAHLELGLKFRCLVRRRRKWQTLGMRL